MATANFKTPIYSSRNEGESKTYILDDVITKDFSGPYIYQFQDEVVPKGFNIFVDRETLKDVLLVPSGFDNYILSIGTYNENKEFAVATTNVILEPSPFEDALQSFLENPNLQQNLSTTKNDWAKIINRGTNEKVDDGIKYPGGDVVKPL
jgi:hypothetical protein